MAQQAANNQNGNDKYASVVVKKPSLSSRLYKYRYFYVMVIPVLIILALFFYWPMLGIRYSFYKYDAFTLQSGPVYIGLDNFAKLLKDEQFYRSFGNTIILSFINLVLATVFSVVVALLINELNHAIFKKFTQTVLYLPHFLSWVVVASIFNIILAVGGTRDQTGLVNAVLLELGAIEEPINWLTEEKYWRGWWYFIQRWKETGWGTIIYIAALSGISPEYYEAAEIDGAGRLKQTWYITLPCLANTILVVFILNLAKIMNLFESVFVLYNASVYDVADVIKTYNYRVGLTGLKQDFGYSTAIGLFNSVVSLILVTAANSISAKIRGYGIV